MSKKMWAIGLAVIAGVWFGGEIKEGGMKFARLVQNHIFMVDGKVPVTAEPCCCEPSPSPSLSPDISPSPSVASSPSASPSASPLPSASPSPSDGFPGEGWYCLQFYTVFEFHGAGNPCTVGCGDVVLQNTFCQYILDQDDWDSQNFGVCVEEVTADSCQYSLLLVASGPYFTDSECQAGCP